MLKNGKSLDFKRFSGIEKAHRNSIEITVGFMAESKGFFRRTPVCLRVASLLDHVGKNSPPDCFLPQTSLLPPCSNPFIYFCQCKKQALRPAFRFGGEQGIRTLEQALTCYTISNRAPSASSDNSPNSFSLFN